MSASDNSTPLIELEAGRALGDLSAEEWAELEAAETDPSSDLMDLAAMLDTAEEAAEVSLPSHLADRLRADIPTSIQNQTPPVSTAESDTQVTSAPETKPKTGAETNITPIGSGTHETNETPLLLYPQVAWAVAAACFAFAALAMFRQSGSSTDAPPSAQSVASLKEVAADEVVASFAGPEGSPYAAMSGEVVWSSDQQDGYLTLKGLPTNDPTAEQYQLWIVDPERDAEPIDGGVFDVAEEGSVIRIAEKLPVGKPVAFVITLEKPGGVVVSDQEVVVAIASAG